MAKKLLSKKVSNSSFWRRQQQALIRLTKSRHLRDGNFDAALREISKNAAQVLKVERVGVWFYEENRSEILCVELYELSRNRHSNGVRLKESDYPHYFKALEGKRTIVANQAQRHPSTREFTEAYLRPLGITSLLDAPIRVGGEIVGIVCHEHVGQSRTWRSEEQQFAGSIADMLALVIEAKERMDAESALRAGELRFYQELKEAHGELEKQFAVRTEQLKTIHQQLLHSEKLCAIGKLSASIAHEINNPLFGIRNVLERVSELAILDNATKELTEMAKKECNRIAEFLLKLKDFYRPSRVIVEPIHLHEVIHDTLMLFSKRCSSRKIKFEKKLHHQPIYVLGVVDQIKQVLLNLINNAEEAITDAGGKITIKTEIANQLVKLRIIDNGCGIPEEQLSSIFDPFFTTKRNGNGTGLGLSISNDIVKQHHGAIRVESTLKRGTIFTVQLPLAPNIYNLTSQSLQP
jgi:signal transduction histidine kinase